MSATPEVRTVTFDVGGTLMQPWPSVGHVYAEAAAKQGKNLPVSKLNAQFIKGWRALKNFNHSRDEWRALVAESFAGLLDEPVSDEFFADIYDRFAEPEAWQIFPDTRPALEVLASRGINLGIISNWDERLIPLLEKMGLAKYFDAIVVSCDVGFAKPSPVIFDHASRKLGEAPQFILHVGDSREHDVDGALASGFQARILERVASELRPGSIRSLAELREI